MNIILLQNCEAEAPSSKSIVRLTRFNGSYSERSALIVSFLSVMVSLSVHQTNVRLVLSRIRGLHDEYNGFWIGWSDLLAILYNYIQI
jgi:hypothetical protein